MQNCFFFKLKTGLSVSTISVELYPLKLAYYLIYAFCKHALARSGHFKQCSYLHANRFSSTLPTELGKLLSLEYLYVFGTFVLVYVVSL